MTDHQKGDGDYEEARDSDAQEDMFASDHDRHNEEAKAAARALFGEKAEKIEQVRQDETPDRPEK